jgi:hypothetical protein
VNALGGWRFGAVVAALLAVMGVVMAVTAAGECQTWDEGIHLASGYSYIKTGDFRMNREHPPLFKLLAGLALVPLKPILPLDDPSWQNAAQIEFGDAFMLKNYRRVDRILRYGRAPTMAITLLLCLAVALWTRRRFGAAVALGAVFLCVFDPNLVAHGRYVTNDVIVTLFTFLTVTAWARYLETRRKRDLAAAGVVLGLALVSKFSALFLAPVVVLLYLFRWWQQRAHAPVNGAPRLSFGDLAKSVAVLAVIGALIIGFAYGPGTMRALHGPALNDTIQPTTAVSKGLLALGYFFDLPAHPYLLGLNRVGEFNKGGHNAYLLGRHSMHGWWYYYPVVFAVKTPTAVLLLIALAVGIGIFRIVKASSRKNWLRDLPLRWLVLIVPVAVYWAMLLSSHVDLGVRYLLPTYPFLYILLAAALVPRARAWMVVAVVALQLVEFVRIYPDYLAFFNTVSGGPGNGPKYVVDSNIDWGQDLKKLRKYLDSIGYHRKICISYFGTANLVVNGLTYVGLPETNQIEQRRQVDCIAAVSVTDLYEAYGTPGSRRWIREMKPIAKVGYSIYIYDLRKRRTP